MLSITGGFRTCTKSLVSTVVMAAMMIVIRMMIYPLNLFRDVAAFGSFDNHCIMFCTGKEIVILTITAMTMIITSMMMNMAMVMENVLCMRHSFYDECIAKILHNQKSCRPDASYANVQYLVRDIPQCTI